MRLFNIDLVKGLLILLVIVGHVIQGRLDDNFLRTLIYSFHMPLFIGLSGYLCQSDQLGKLSLTALVRKYSFRVMLPWGIAMIAYSVILAHGLDWDRLTQSMFNNFSNPYYHLWFIPAFMSWILFSWMMKKAGFSDKEFFITAILISCIAQMLNTYPELYRGNSMFSTTFTELFYTFRPYNYFYFAFGMMLRKQTLPLPRLSEYLLPVVGFASVWYLFEYPDRTLNLIHSLLFNTALLWLVLKLVSNSCLPRVRAIEWLGVNSLAIYLWHVIPVIFAKEICYAWSEWVFYGTIVIFNLLLFAVYRVTSANAFIRKYVYGM